MMVLVPMCCMANSAIEKNKAILTFVVNPVEWSLNAF